MNLNLSRLYQFMRCDVVNNKRKIFIFSLTVVSVMLLYGLSDIFSINISNFHSHLFGWILLGYGLWITSKMYSDLHQSTRGQMLLLLPISNLERFLGRLLLSSVGIIIGISLLFFLASLLVVILCLIMGIPVSLFNPLDPMIINYILCYLFWHAIFFLGAVFFKRSVMTKTILCLCLFSLLFVIVAAMIPGLMFHHIIWLGFPAAYMYHAFYWNYFLILIPICCWIVAYIRLSESEI